MSSTLPNLSIVHTFIALQLVGGIGMALIALTTLLSSSTKRNGTWYSFCVSWVIFSLSFCLLFFAGEQTVYDKETPSYGLCLTQAALIYSTPPMTAATSFALFLDVYWKINATMSGRSIPSNSSYYILYIAPYVLWIALTISFLVVGIAALSAILIIIPTFKPIVRTCFSNDSSTRRSQYLLRAEQHCSTSIGLSPRVHFSIDGFDCAW
ncbi:hypothetical protein K435DRAFT_878435 [Dendrothele bispora CBS 962.96]|uniref:Uncharacterized protein n=1 Tax=Dendrothele bispora (strain CBS 962.96) TaxID=1314807 RepID=A0A4S8KN84_DENBC|nr:hypothetical protein K435DRAFT_878435 [Dendrothele bispora CBS 962.96]